MADLNKKEVVLDNKEQSSGLLDRSRVTLAAAVLAVGLSTSVQAKNLLEECDFNKNGSVDTAEMYGIKSRAEFRAADPKIREIVQKEQRCKIDYDLAKGKEDLAKGKEESARLDRDLAKGKEESARLDRDLAKGKEESARLDRDLAKGKEEGKRLDEDYSKMIQILAMLDPKEARKYLTDEIKKIETQLKTEKDEKKRKSLTYRLETLKTRLTDLDKKVA